MRRPLALFGWASLALAGAWSAERGQAEPRWWKGNTHTHTLWSDADGAPELVTAWYRERDYRFLVLSDHNVMLEGERWFPIDAVDDPRLTSAHVEELRAKFGAGSVEVRERDGRREMRLQTLDELRERFEQPGEFLLIPGEEITDGTSLSAVHVNGLNLAERIAPQGGSTELEMAQRNLDAVLAQGRRLGRPVLAHLNHPNFKWSFTVDDVAGLRSERFFEIYNGHPGTGTNGDERHPSAEVLWDEANARRVRELELPLLYGLASDDAHDHHELGPTRSNCGRGWIAVRARELSAGSLIAALRAGDFYASTGVELEDVRRDGQVLTVDIAAERETTYTTHFVGLRRAGAGAEILLETSADPAVYALTGEELFVRARVRSSRPHGNPSFAGEHECAWTQPVQPE